MVRTVDKELSKRNQTKHIRVCDDKTISSALFPGSTDRIAALNIVSTSLSLISPTFSVPSTIPALQDQTKPEPHQPPPASSPP